MFPGEKRFRLRSVCTAVMEGAFSRGCGGAGEAARWGGGGQLTMRGKRGRGGAVRIRDKTCGCLKKQTAAQAGWQKFVCVWKGPEVEVGWLCDEVVGCMEGGLQSLERRGGGEGCWGCLVLRGNISKAKRKSCQINFSPFQSHPWEFLPHFTSADLAPLFGWRSFFFTLFLFLFFPPAAHCGETSHPHTNPSANLPLPMHLVLFPQLQPCFIHWPKLQTWVPQPMSSQDLPLPPFPIRQQQKGFKHVPPE